MPSVQKRYSSLNQRSFSLYQNLNVKIIMSDYLVISYGNIIRKIAAAALAITVPGPKIAATPWSYRNW